MKEAREAAEEEAEQRAKARLFEGRGKGLRETPFQGLEFRGLGV